MKKTIFILTTILSTLFHANTLNAKNPFKSFTAVGYDSHVELKWESQSETKDVKYKIYASHDGKDFFYRGETTEKWYNDFVTDLGRNINLHFKVEESVKGKETGSTQVRQATIRDFSDEELMEMVQQYTFRYFWDFGESVTGLSHERTSSGHGNIITTGGSGFGLMAIIVGVERGYITREQAVEKFLTATSFLESTDRYHGIWAHWYSAESLKTYPFSKYDDGGDVVESAFMAQGLLTARQYFNGNSKKEKELRNRITKLWETMEWDFYTQGKDALYWHWSKNYGWKKNHSITGYNECLIAFVLAASSPTHSISPDVYHKGWANPAHSNIRNYSDYYGITLPMGNKKHFGGPLFFAHYSYLGLDPRGLSDRYANYWEQNKRHTLINRAYCIDNPYGYEGYGENFWGLTASDKVPKGYTAHAPGFQRDHGTVTPTAAISSIPYTPEESLKVLKNLYRNYGQELWGQYGFYDAINLSLSDNPKEQVRKTYIGIDQGPIIVMIENYRSGLLWKYFMKDKDVLKGLKKLGFNRYGKPIEVK